MILLVLLTACGSSREALEDLAAQGAPCDTGEDCCVVMDDCRGTAFVIGGRDFERARDLAREAADEARPGCQVLCDAPRVELQCVQGRCAGVAAPEGMPSLGEDHCGSALLDLTADRDTQILECVP